MTFHSGVRVNLMIFATILAFFYILGTAVLSIIISVYKNLCRVLKPN